ncbi:MAG: Uma2 family endonuclease [Solirubrobacteraceae bacterium]
MPLQVAVSDIHQLTAEEYARLVQSGGLDDLRVELIDGLLCDMSPKSPAHENAIAHLTALIASALDFGRYDLRIQCALSVGDSAPEPDLAIVERDAPKPFHPASAVLVIEVCHSSHDRDLRVKPAVYAAASVSEYWVLDLRDGRIVVHRRPESTAGYLETEVVGADGAVQARSVQLPAVVMRDLLQAAGA